MSGAEINLDVKRFIAEFIDSAEKLDVLLLLHGQPARRWTATDVSRAVFTVPTSSTMRLESLVAAGLVRSTGGSDPEYWYEPSSAQLGSRVDALAAAYRADRVAVINLVFQRPADPLQSFSNAFRLR